MKIIKMFGLAAIAAAALMAVVGVGSASATRLTAPDGTFAPAGTLITAEVEVGTSVILHPPFGDIICEKSHVEGKTSNAGSTTETVKGTISTLSFTSCNATVTVLKPGSLEIHWISGNDGTVTSSGTEVTVEFFGTHCIFATSNTDIGTLTGATTTKTEHATFDISATIPRTGGRSGAFCGSTAKWTGNYTITTPKNLNVDA
jgi:hypothetical protein